MSRPIEPFRNPPLCVQSRIDGAGIMGGAATVVAPAPTPTSTPKRPSASARSAVSPLRPSRALIEHYLRYEGWTLEPRVGFEGHSVSARWVPPSQANADVFAIVCSMNDERFVSEALGTLTYAESTGDMVIYRLGILASAERLIGPAARSPREPWDDGYDAATVAAVATLFVMARVDQAKWEATR